jgi:hypothetical protein
MSDVSGPLTWTVRALGWLIALGVIAVFVHKYGSSRLTTPTAQCVEQSRSERNALANGQQLVDCIYSKSGPVERWLLNDTKQLVGALPYAPCRYIGTWRATRPGAIYTVTLKDDSTFIAEPIEPRNAGTITGSWGFYKNRLIWFYDNGRVWPPDTIRSRTERRNLHGDRAGSLDHDLYAAEAVQLDCLRADLAGGH